MTDPLIRRSRHTGHHARMPEPSWVFEVQWIRLRTAPSGRRPQAGAPALPAPLDPVEHNPATQSATDGSYKLGRARVRLRLMLYSASRKAPGATTVCSLRPSLDGA
jgi:hypothetical protein